MRVLVILAHPRDDSLCSAIAGSFQEGLKAAGIEHRFLSLGELTFDPHVRLPSPADQRLEGDLVCARGLIDWAEHLVFVYPTWWGTYPALLKGFLDRMLTPGFAFRHLRDGRWEPLLKGKTAELLTTMDTPRWIYRWIYRAPGDQALAAATPGFCGIRTVRRQAFSPVLGSTARARTRWLAAARERARSLASGVVPRWKRPFDTVVAWLAALRLHFYPLTVIAYTLGALAAARGEGLAHGAYWLGLFAILMLEAATVFSNELFDYESDRRNRNFGPFNGGSRVLVDGRLHAREIGTGTLLAVGTAVILFAAALQPLASHGPAAAVIAVVGVMALGYTVPPLRLSHRGAGEIVVAVTHSIGVILPGYMLQGGAWFDPLPWLLAAPLGLAVLPAITLAGIPDCDADRAARKRTLVVRLGKRPALVFAMAATTGSAIVAALWAGIGGVSGIYRSVALLAVPIAALLLWRLARRWREAESLARIDGLIALALTYALWFGLAPLWRLGQ